MDMEKIEAEFEFYGFTIEELKKECEYTVDKAYIWHIVVCRLISIAIFVIFFYFFVTITRWAIVSYALQASGG